jgi:hypothetical protein
MWKGEVGVATGAIVGEIAGVDVEFAETATGATAGDAVVFFTGAKVGVTTDVALELTAGADVGFGK